MSFNSIEFLLFLPTVFLIYWLLPHRGQNIFLLCSSYFFLCYIHPWFGILIFLVTFVNYCSSLAISRWPDRKRYFLLLALIFCLGQLGYFKYASFFLDNIFAVLQQFGIPYSQPLLSVLLPVGISFYTFQAIAYTIDVYRQNTSPCSNPIDFALFISFFPQLVAGPIERSRALLPQIQNKRTISPEIIQQGLILLLWGFFKKLVIADNSGLIAYKVFALADPSFYILWSGVFAFGIQILADFWSYTDMARGSALLLGFKLSRNFDHPYFSTSPADFWRRWHMTLSYWLRDYVYIPLGGSKVESKLRKSFNIVFTFLLSGLWHGASWNFIIWGGYHGVLVLLDRASRNIVEKFRSFLPASARFFFKPFQILCTFILINAGWLFFRETNIANIFQYLQLSPGSSSLADMKIALYFFVLTLIYSLPMFFHGVVHMMDIKRNGLQGQYSDNLLLLRPVISTCLLLGILTLRSPEPATFIYFQF